MKTRESPPSPAQIPAETPADPSAPSAPAAATISKRDAWEQTRDARSAIPSEQFCEANFSIEIAAIVLGSAYRRVLPLRAQLQRSLPDFDLRCLDLLPSYSAAMQYGDERIELRAKSVPPVEVNAAAEKHLAKLMRALVPLADEGLFPAKLLEELRIGTGWTDRAKALSRIVTAVSELWPVLANRTTITQESLRIAAEFSEALYEHLSMKGEPTSPTEMELERRQAITLAFRSYEQVRRAVIWLRWAENDASEIAPSVHRNRFMKPRRSPNTPQSASAPR